MKKLGFATTACLMAAGLALLALAPRFSAADQPAAKDNATGGMHAPVVSGFANESDKTEHVFYRGNDGHIFELYNKVGDNSGWHSRDISAGTGVPKAAGNPFAFYWSDNKSEHVLFRGEDDQVHELFFSTSAGRWEHTSLSEQAKAPKATGDPAGYVEEGNKTEHVIYRTSEGEVIELFNKQGETAGWKSQSLTDLTKAPKSASDFSAYYWRGNKSQHVFYRGTDDGIHELYLGEGKWMHNDLSKAAKADGRPCAYVEEGNKTQHVDYRAADGAIVELFSQYGQPEGWQARNLSAEANAPTKAVGSPSGFYLNSRAAQGARTQHVVYRGEKGEVFELYLGQNGKWAEADLTTTTKAAKAAGDPFGFGLNADGTAHVVYQGADGKIWEMYNRPSGPDNGWHAAELAVVGKGE